MANLLEKLKLDEDKVVNGVWYRNVLSGADFLVAMDDNKKFKDYMQKIAKPFRHQVRHGNLDEDKAIELWCDAASRYILLDWANVEDATGKLIKYTPEEGFKYLLALPDLRKIIGDLSEDHSSYREDGYVEESAEMLKNT